MIRAETTRLHRFDGIGSRLRHRGVRTAKGGAGFCRSCRRECPEGPDVCLGLLEDVVDACCGHGVVEPWVVYRGELFRGEDAQAIFASARRVTR